MYRSNCTLQLALQNVTATFQVSDISQLASSTFPGAGGVRRAARETETEARETEPKARETDPKVQDVQERLQDSKGHRRGRGRQGAFTTNAKIDFDALINRWLPPSHGSRRRNPLVYSLSDAPMLPLAPFGISLEMKMPDWGDTRACRLELEYEGYADLDLDQQGHANDFEFRVSFRNPLQSGNFSARTPKLWAGIAPNPRGSTADVPAMANVGLMATSERVPPLAVDVCR